MKFAMISFAAAIAPTMAAEFSEVYLLNAGTCTGTGGVIITENAECIAAIEKLDETVQTGTNGKEMYISAVFGSTITNNGAGMRGRPTGCTWETDHGNMEMWARSDDAECGSFDYNCVCKCTSRDGCVGDSGAAPVLQADSLTSVTIPDSLTSVTIPDSLTSVTIPDSLTSVTRPEAMLPDLFSVSSGHVAGTHRREECSTTFGSLYSDTNTCPSGFVRVTTSAECDAADAALGTRASGNSEAGEHVRGRDQFMNSEPGGCYQFSGKYHLNLAPNGVGVASGGTHLYCKQTVCQAPVVPEELKIPNQCVALCPRGTCDTRGDGAKPECHACKQCIKSSMADQDSVISMADRPALRPEAEEILETPDGVNCDEECVYEWETQRYGRETQKTMCTDEAYHIDCKACRFCQDLIDSEADSVVEEEHEEEDVGQDLIDSEADSVVEEEHEEEDVGTTNFDGTNGNMHGIFDSSMFVDGCNPKRCPEWDCRMWCHCFETNPNVELMFESVQYGESLARNCPEDDTACDCDLE